MELKERYFKIENERDRLRAVACFEMEGFEENPIKGTNLIPYGILLDKNSGDDKEYYGAAIPEVVSFCGYRRIYPEWEIWDWSDFFFSEIRPEALPVEGEYILLICKQIEGSYPKDNNGLFAVIEYREDISKEWCFHQVGLFWTIENALLFAKTFKDNI